MPDLAGIVGFIHHPPKRIPLLCCFSKHTKRLVHFSAKSARVFRPLLTESRKTLLPLFSFTFFFLFLKVEKKKYVSFCLHYSEYRCKIPSDWLWDISLDWLASKTHSFWWCIHTFISIHFAEREYFSVSVELRFFWGSKMDA